MACKRTWVQGTALAADVRAVFRTFTLYSHASLNDGILSEKCAVGRFRRCANTIECNYTNLDSTV